MPRAVRDEEPPRDSQELDRALMLGLLGEIGTRIDQYLGDRDSQPERPRTYEYGLALLRSLLTLDTPILTPELEVRAPLGHTCPEIDRMMGAPAGASLEVLENLADLGLLERELYNLVHICPRCRRGLINLRQTCPACNKIDLRVERLVHHFACAYVGLESEFQRELVLRCPKCRRELYQVGQDFERPHETYVCNACEHTCEEPRLEAQCLHCAASTPSFELEVVRIHRYRPTELAVRAVELGRLTGLDLTELMVDYELKLDAREFLLLEMRREVQRVARHGGTLSAALLWFELDGEPYPIFRRCPTQARLQLANVLGGMRAPLDLIARLDAARIGLLLPNTDAEGESAAQARVLSSLADLSLRTEEDRELLARWRGATWSGKDLKLEEVVGFYEWADPLR